MTVEDVVRLRVKTGLGLGGLELGSGSGEA